MVWLRYLEFIAKSKTLYKNCRNTNDIWKSHGLNEKIKAIFRTTWAEIEWDGLIGLFLWIQSVAQ